MKECGAIWYDERLLIGGRLQLAAMNKAAYETLKTKHTLKFIKNAVSLIRSTDEGQEELADRKRALFDDMRAMLKQPNDIFEAKL